jgi:chromosome segregation ATPase
MFNKKNKLIEQQNRTIADLNEKLLSQQQQLDMVKAQLEAYRQREFAISRALTDAAETANRIVIDAQKESDDIHDSAQQEYIASQKKGEAVLQSAYEKSRDIIKNAEKTSEEKIKNTDDAISAYVSLLNQFNEAMKEQARQAEENAKKISDYYCRLTNALPELFSEVPQFSDTAVDNPVQLLDPEGDPARLMRNIYAIQNRYLPHEDIPDRTSVPEEAGPDEINKPLEQETDPEEKNLPQFDAEEAEVVKVSDIVSEEVGTINTEELIAQTASLDSNPLNQAE